MQNTSTHSPQTAFVLGAGLGTRLRPLTEHCPKPLLPVRGRPLIHHILDRLVDVGIQKILINTHHASEKYHEVFPQKIWRGVPLIFEHEPVLLDTAGGLKNISQHWTDDRPLLLYNGDILTNISLQKLISEHDRMKNEHGAICSLALRSSGGPAHIHWDSGTGLVRDIRSALAIKHNTTSRDLLYTGIAMIERAMLEAIPAGEVIGLVPVWLNLLRSGKQICGVLLDDGDWSDIGDLSTYAKLTAEG